MSYSFWVMVDKRRLPTVADLGRAVEASGFPLAIDTDWAWDSHSGWLPMQWRGEESGCEVAFEELEDEDLEAAREAGFSDVDAAVVLTTGGWDSLQSGVSFAACLAALAEGCIAEDEDEYIPHTQAAKWAKDAIEGADAEQAREAEEEKAREEALAAGGLEEQLIAALAACLPNQEVAFFQVMGNIGFKLPSGHGAAGGNWRLHVGEKCFDNTRSNSVGSRKIELWEHWSEETPELWEAGELTEGQAKESELLEAEFEHALELDEEDTEAAVAEIETWPEKFEIKSFRFIPPFTLEAVFSVPGEPRLEFIGGGQSEEVSVYAPPLRFAIAREIELR